LSEHLIKIRSVRLLRWVASSSLAMVYVDWSPIRPAADSQILCGFLPVYQRISATTLPPDGPSGASTPTFVPSVKRLTLCSAWTRSPTGSGSCSCGNASLRCAS